jgi:phospholipid/cholesterol/gamma-HCH transport system substrate-binding protein
LGVTRNARAVAGTALAVAAVGFLLLLMTAGTSYVINARFLNAGGLVSGGEVEIAGRQVGSIAGVTLTPDGQANIKLSIGDSSVTPLHLGTRAAIRAVGQAGITNNYVLLTPGPATTPALRDGAVLPTTQTSGIVPIDALLNSFGATQRSNLDQLIAASGQVYAGSGGRYFNGMLAKLSPAFAELEGFSGSFAEDRAALGELVHTASVAAGAMASRSTELTSAVTHTADAMRAIAAQRTALSDLVQAQSTLKRAGTALTALRPTLRDIVPVAAPARTLLQHVVSLLPNAYPVVNETRLALPSLDQALTGLTPLAVPAATALQTLGPAMHGLEPIFAGLRYYSTDLILGALAGLWGRMTAEYNSTGHYVKANFTQPPQTFFTGPLASELSAHPLPGGVIGMRTGLTRRCPGGDQPPAPDGSSPWNLGPKWCTASNDEPLSVNFP